MTTKPRRKTTPARARKETVAEAKGGQGKGDPQGQGKGVTGVSPNEPHHPVSEPVEAPPPPTPPSPLSKGFCDNHPDSPAVLVTDYPWTSPQRFCMPCVPPQYRYLL